MEVVFVDVATNENNVKAGNRFRSTNGNRKEKILLGSVRRRSGSVTKGKPARDLESKTAFIQDVSWKACAYMLFAIQTFVSHRILSHCQTAGHEWQSVKRMTWLGQQQSLPGSGLDDAMQSPQTVNTAISSHIAQQPPSLDLVLR